MASSPHTTTTAGQLGPTTDVIYCTTYGPDFYTAPRRPNAVGSPSTVHVAADISPVPYVALHLPHIVRGAVHVAMHLPSLRTSPREPSILCAALWTSSAPSTSPALEVVYAPVHVLHILHVAAHLLHNVYGALHMGHAATHVLSAVNIAMHAPRRRPRHVWPSKPYTPRYTSSASRTSTPTSFTMCTVPHTCGS
ncbi:hypothetical protein B0H14DRAFT_3905434 [Mycena olivaceomarginata]|nr:hypothetical protein B0H14DRAFT_3905434 [Mycena olivaceomarginata]